MRESVLWPSLAEYWHPVALSEDVDEGPLAVRLLDERVVVYRLGSGEDRAFHDLCIHRGTPISLGRVEGETIVCAYHGWTYDAGGKCIRIPSIPSGHPIPKKACLTDYLAAERYGIIWVCLAKQPRAPIPDVPELEDPNYRIYFRQRKPWQCTAARSIENFVDFAHFPWIHDGILGDRDQPLAPIVDVRQDGEDLWFEADFSRSIEKLDEDTDIADPDPYRRRYRLTRPFSIVQWMRMPQDKTEIYFYPCTPHSARESTRFLIVARNYDFDTPEIVHGPITVKGEEMKSRDGAIDGRIPEYIHLLDVISDQDKPIVENQRPEELPLDLTEELHVRGPDAVAVAYRRFMRELGVDIDGPRS